MKNTAFYITLLIIAIAPSGKRKVLDQGISTKSGRESLAMKIDNLVAVRKFKEAKDLYIEHFHLFQDDAMSDVILFDLKSKGGSDYEASTFKQMILSDPDEHHFDKMAIAFLSGDEAKGKEYLLICEKDSTLQESVSTLIKLFRRQSEKGEFVSLKYKIDWTLSRN